MGCAEVCRSEHVPFCIEPERGQVAENASEPPSSEHWGVFHEDEGGSNIANDASEFNPETGAGAAEPGSSSSGADVLAGEAPRHHVNTASPRSSVKGAHIIPDGKRREASVVLTCDENACGVGVEFDGADGPPAEQMPTEDAATSAREKSQLTHGLHREDCYPG